MNVISRKRMTACSHDWALGRVIDLEAGVRGERLKHELGLARPAPADRLPAGAGCPGGHFDRDAVVAVLDDQRPVASSRARCARSLRGRPGPPVIGIPGFATISARAVVESSEPC